MKIPQSAIKEGLADTKWPGRFEIIHEKPMFIIDGAHNPEGVEAFTENIKMYFPGKKVTFILGVLRDKDYISIIETLAPLAEGFISVTPLSNRSVSADELGRIVNKYCNNTIVSDTINEAVETALTQAKPNDIICALGSLYYIGEIRKIMFAAG